MKDVVRTIGIKAQYGIKYELTANLLRSTQWPKFQYRAKRTTFEKFFKAAAKTNYATGEFPYDSVDGVREVSDHIAAAFARYNRKGDLTKLCVGCTVFRGESAATIRDWALGKLPALAHKNRKNRRNRTH